MNKRVSKSLRLELFCAVLASITVGVLVFVLSFVLGYVLLDNTVYAKSFAESMSEQYAEQLQDYVTEENISDVVERYRAQVQTYANALEQIFEQSVKAQYLYFFRLDRFVSVM